MTTRFVEVGTMGQLGFFDADKRLAAISAKGDPLEMIDRVVPFESFRAEIEAVVLTPVEDKKSSAGRKPIDVIVMFRMLVLQSLYNLSDEQVEYQVSDRMSFTRFLRLGIEDCIPDGTTLWLFREALGKAGLIEKLFKRFSRHLEAKGYIARGGQMVDATIVPVPKQRNSREENEAVKAGKTPKEWQKNRAKNRQKDKDARSRRSPRSDGSACAWHPHSRGSCSRRSSYRASWSSAHPCLSAGFSRGSSAIPLVSCRPSRPHSLRGYYVAWGPARSWHQSSGRHVQCNPSPPNAG